jgi:hypothetical protein
MEAFIFTESVFIGHPDSDNGVSLFSQIADPRRKAKAPNVLQCLQRIDAPELLHIVQNKIALCGFHRTPSFL